jgi:hypothetical protein
MPDTADLDFSVMQCVSLEREIRELLGQIPEMDANQKRTGLLMIEGKLSRANAYVATLEMDIFDLTNERAIERYTRKEAEHRQTVQMLENGFQEAKRSVQTEELARAQSTTPQDLMREASRLQGEQKKSLDNARLRMGEIQAIGAITLEDIGQQTRVTSVPKKKKKAEVSGGAGCG